jgi:hypothetical protein
MTSLQRSFERSSTKTISKADLSFNWREPLPASSAKAATKILLCENPEAGKPLTATSAHTMNPEDEEAERRALPLEPVAALTYAQAREYAEAADAALEKILKK